MTSQIIQALNNAINPRGVAVLVEAEHMCMAMRGVQKSGSSTITTQFSGLFRNDPQEQARFFQMVRSPSLRG
jgi:GTP cyclohydrolase IA